MHPPRNSNLVAHPFLLGLLIAAQGVLLTGCASDRSPDPMDYSPAVVAGGAATDTSEPTGTPLTSEIAKAEGAVQLVYSDLTKPDRTLTVERAAPSSKPGEQWKVRKLIDGKPASELTLVRNQDGGVALVSIIEYADDAITTFTPPMVTTPAKLAPGTGNAIKQKLEMKVTELSRPGKVKATGSAESTLTYLGEQPVRGQPETRGLLLMLVLRAKLSVAEVVSTTESWYDGSDRRAGIIAEHRAERVRVLGFNNRSADTTWVLSPAAGK